MPRIQITEPGKTPQPYKVKLDRETIKIGRASGNDLPLTDPSTSSNHCVIRRVQGGYVLEDNKSTNGVKLDDQRFSKLDLNLDLEFMLGDVEIDFRFTDEEFDILAEEDDFESEQKPMLPPSGDDKKKKQQERSEAKRKKLEAENDDIELEEDEDEEDEDENKPSQKKKSSSSKHSTSRASRMVKTSDDEDQDDRPPPRPKVAAAPRRAERIASSKQGNPMVTLLFIILCIVGFVVGLSIKHYKTTGSPLIWEKGTVEADTADKTPEK